MTDPENEKLRELIDESIALELNMHELYKLFSEAYKEDQDFWWRLSLEEGNHASLIEGIKKLILDGVIPRQMLPVDPAIIRAANRTIMNLREEFGKTAFPRERTLEEGLRMETQAAEQHLQVFLSKSTDSRIVKVFQQLHAADKNHAERIRQYGDTIRQKTG